MKEKKTNEQVFTDKLSEYGFKKKPMSEDGVHMWEMDPSKLRKKKENEQEEK